MKKRILTLALTLFMSAGAVFGAYGYEAGKLAYVNAGEQLGETDFDDGKGLPWHIVESATGVMDFAIEDGVYRIDIINPGGASNGGEDRWDCQFRHRGLKIVQGHTYHVHYEIKASNAGKYYTKIGNLSGDVEIWHNMSNGSDLGNTWDPIPYDTPGQWKTVDLRFTAGQGMEVAEWAFHLGGDGQYTNGVCFPAGTVIEFDNMSLTDETSDENDYVEEEEWMRSDILTNQVSYFEGFDKKATLISREGSPVKFSLIDENGKEVWSGKSEPKGHDDDSDDDVHILDFSEYDEPGRYTLKAENGAVSREFAIGDSETYSAMLYDALNYFYQNRSGISIDSEYITSGDKSALARAAGHMPDNAQVLSSFEDNNALAGKSQDVTGGWYDAGDHGKYVVNGGISVWIMQNQYETALRTGMEAAYADGTMNIPENNNGHPDILDEARWEMDFIQKMEVKDGEYKGMVYHKVGDDKWTGLGLAPADDNKNRVIAPPSTAATLNAAAAAAQAARLWAGIDDAYASQCLDFAKRTYEAAKAHPDIYAPIGDFEGSGAYGDDDVSDEFYWAASELYVTTGEDTYHQDMKGSKFYLQIPVTLGGGESVDTYGSFDWGHTAALGTISVALNPDKTGGDAETAKASLVSAAEAYVNKEREQGYGLPYAQSTLSSSDDSKGYIWGSNSLVAANSMVCAYAYILTEDKKFLNGAVSGMDYLLGRNANDYSFVTGYGTHTSKYPHHRYWSGLIDSAFPFAPNGILVGGPNCGMEDPWVRGSGWKKGEIPAAKCYMDHIEAYSTNECTINWNAPLAWLAGFITGNTKGGIKTGAVNLSPASDTSAVTEKDSAAGTEPAIKKDQDKGSVKSTAADNESASAPEEKEKDGMPVWLMAMLVLCGVGVLVTAEVLVYKYMMSKKQAAAGGVALKPEAVPEAVPEPVTDIPVQQEIVQQPEVQQYVQPEVQVPVQLKPVVQEAPRPDYLYDAEGNPQMRILYDAQGNPVYVPLK